MFIILAPARVCSKAMQYSNILYDEDNRHIANNNNYIIATDNWLHGI